MPTAERKPLRHLPIRRALFSIACAGALTAGLSSVPAEATHPGPNGRIVFHRGDDSGFDQVWTANPDLTAQHKLTDEKAYSGFATWSPDATHIAFDSNRSDPDQKGKKGGGGGGGQGLHGPGQGNMGNDNHAADMAGSARFVVEPSPDRTRSTSRRSTSWSLHLGEIGAAYEQLCEAG
jgi:hypothetical protein